MNDKLRRSVQSVRGHLAALGCDMSDLTDQEVVDAVERFHCASRESMVSVQEAADSLTRVMKMMRMEAS